MDLNEFFYTGFAQRIVEHGQYSLVEYLVYGAILLAICFLILYPLLNKRGIKFDFRFLLAILPYVLLGSALRVLEDMRILGRSPNPLELEYYFITPGIYIAIAAITLASLGIAFLASKKTGIGFYKIFAGIGLVLGAPIALFEIINFQAASGFAIVIALVIIISAAIIFAFKKTGMKLLQSNLNKTVLVSQLLDGCATFVATTFYRCGEQHPVSGFFLDLWPFSFVLVKIILVLAIVYYVDREIKNENLAGFIKILVAILGFATGTRDLFMLGVGICL